MDKNGERIVRRAALELSETNDIVKIAGVVGSVYDWISGILGSANKVQRAKMTSKGKELIGSLEDTHNIIARLLEAIRSVDTENVGPLEEQARQAVGQLGAELGSFRRSVEEFVDDVPLGVLTEDGRVTSEERAAEVMKHPSTDPVLYKQLVEAFPQRLRESLPDGRPMRHINVPVSQFPWMQQFEPQHIVISPKVQANIINDIKKALAAPNIWPGGHGPVKTKRAIREMVDRNEDDIMMAFRRSLLSNGYLYDYYWPKASKEVKQPPANQMMMNLHGGRIALRDPKFGDVYVVELPLVMVRDMMASLTPSKKLSVRGARNVRLVGTPPQAEGVEEVAPIGGLMEDVEESERKVPVPEPEVEPAPEVAAEEPPAPPVPTPEQEPTEEVPLPRPEPIEETAPEGEEGLPGEEEEPIEKETSIKRRLELLSMAVARPNLHQEARNTLTTVFNKMWPGAPLSAIQAAQAVAGLESQYGRGWKEPGRGSNNWGAVQSTLPTNKVTGKKSVHYQDEYPDQSVFNCPANTFLRTDSNPAGRRYWVCFKQYDSPVAGAMGLVGNIFFAKHKNRGELLRNWAMRNGSLYDFSTIMRETNYYGGRGSKEQAIKGHAGAMKYWIDRFAPALGEAPAMPLGQPEDIQMVMARYGGPQQPQQWPQQQPQQWQQQPQQVAQKTEEQTASEEAEQVINEALTAYTSAGPLEKMIRTAIEKDILPVTRTLISFDPEIPLYMRVRLAHVLSSALDEEIGADTSLHYGEDTVQVECDVRGTEETVLQAVAGLSEGVSQAFEMATGTYVKTAVCPDCRSAYGVLESETSDECFRKFAMYMMGRR